MSAGCLALVPLRSWRDPKTRLRAVLTPEERTALVAALAGAVVEALDEMPLVVLTDDDEVLGWCADRGVAALRPAIDGLNEAVVAGRDHAAATGYRHVAVVPADLARPRRLVSVIAGAAKHDGAVTAVADRHADGTNLLIVPTGAAFGFAYGPGSFRAHRSEAERLRLRFDEIVDDELAWDVDTPDDLDWYRRTR